MYQPLTSCVENEGRLEAASWTKNLLLGVARVVVLKSKVPLMAVWAERLGFVQEERIRLSVSPAWETRRYHSWEGNFGGVAAVGIRGNKLEVNVVLSEGFMHGMGALVVEDAEIGGCTVFLEVFMACCKGCSDIQGLSVL